MPPCVNVGRPGGDNPVAIDQHLPADVHRFAIEHRRRFEQRGCCNCRRSHHQQGQQKPH